MRTTLTINDDLFDRIRQAAARTRRRFGEVLNEKLRVGFSANSTGGKKGKFKVEPFAAKGFAAGVDERKLNHLLDVLDSEKFRR